MAITSDLPVRENCSTFVAPDGDVSIDNLIDSIERTAGEDSALVSQHMAGVKFLVRTRNASEATQLLVAEGFRVGAVNVPVEAIGPPVTYVNVYRYPAYLSNEILSNALAQYDQRPRDGILTPVSTGVTCPPSPRRGSLGTSQSAASAEGTTETDSEDLECEVAYEIVTSRVPVLKPGEDAREPTREDAPIESRGYYGLPEDPERDKMTEDAFSPLPALHTSGKPVSPAITQERGPVWRARSRSCMRTGAEEAYGKAQRHHSRELRRASPAESQERCHERQSRLRSHRRTGAEDTSQRAQANAKAGSQACADRAAASVADIATPLPLAKSQKLTKGGAGKGGDCLP
ncbi:hypothetical protein MRX96_042203 [Rhipicephalus microplus]